MSELTRDDRFPRILRTIWDLADADSAVQRRCDALDRPTLQRPFETANGTYWVCGETGQFERVDFNLDALPDWYDDSWAQQTLSERKLARYRRFVAGFAKHKQTGKLFEVGTGLGGVLKAVVDQGWDAQGCELSPLAAQRAQDFAGAPVHPKAIEDVPLEAEAYDVILMDNVFEHLREPRKVLFDLTQALRPGGVLYIMTLNAQSLSLTHQPRTWYYFNPGHLYVPTVLSFRQYIQAAGLQERWLHTHGFSPSREGKHKAVKQGGIDRLYEKLVGNVGGLLKRGHRMEALLQKA